MNTLSYNDTMTASSITVFDIFNIDFKNIKRALNVLKYENSEYKEKRVLFKQNNKELKFFEKVEIRKTKDDFKNKILLRKVESKLMIFQLKLIIDKLYAVYGEDDLTKSKLSLNDLLDLHHGEKITRTWEDTDYPIQLSYRKGKYIEISVMLDE